MRVPDQRREVVVHGQLTLWLASDLPDSAAAPGALYERRTHVETDLSNLKIILKTELFRPRSDDTFQKELLAAIVSYHLVTQFRQQAAALINEPPRRLSFKRTWTTFNVFLLSRRFPPPAARRVHREVPRSAERRGDAQTAPPPQPPLPAGSLPPPAEIQLIQKTRPETDRTGLKCQTSAIGRTPAGDLAEITERPSG